MSLNTGNPKNKNFPSSKSMGQSSGTRKGGLSAVSSSGQTKQPIAGNKRFREGSESGTSSGNITSIDDTNQDLSQLNSLLDHLTKDEESTKKVINIILGKPTIKSCISEHFMSEITDIHNEMRELKNRVDSMEQYSRRTCLKFSGIPEEQGEHTDNIILKVSNQFILPSDNPLEIHQISRSHRVGPPRDDGVPRDIIVQFASYRDRARVFGNKRNLKSFNQNPSNRYKIFINEALTKKRAHLLFEARKLVKSSDQLENAWTYDGKIIVKTLGKKKITIETEEGLHKLHTFLESPNDPLSPELRPEFAPLTSTPANAAYRD